MATPTAPQPASPPAVIVAQDPPAAPSVTVSTPSTPKPGYLTTEGWLSFLAVVLGALPTTLFTNSPLLTKIVGMAIAALSAANYTASRTSLKRAHLMLSAGAPLATPANGNRTSLLSGLLVVLALAGVLAGVTVGCATASKDVTAAGDKFIDCSKQDLNQLVGDTGISLLAIVAQDLVGGNYLAALEELAKTVGADAVACATEAYDTITSAGSAATSAASPLAVNAHAAVAHFGWTFATQPPKLNAAPPLVPAPVPKSSSLAPGMRETHMPDAATVRAQHKIAAGSAK